MSNTKGGKKSKLFRVATEGDTADGREISREAIQQMADSYDPAKYGARIWLEHMRGLFPDGPFKAYGDVLSIEAHENKDKKLELFAQISPTDELIQMNQQRQKIYSSIEVSPNFAKTGQAYLVGLAVTDNPASLGTEMLSFSAKNPDASPLKARKQSPENLFTASQLVTIEIEEEKTNFADRLEAVRKRLFSREAKTDTEMGELMAAIESVVEHSAQLSEEVDRHSGSFKDMEGLVVAFAKLKTEFTKLQTELNSTDQNIQQRPPATGGETTAILTDC